MEATESLYLSPYYSGLHIQINSLSRKKTEWRLCAFLSLQVLSSKMVLSLVPNDHHVFQIYVNVEVHSIFLILCGLCYAIERGEKANCCASRSKTMWSCWAKKFTSFVDVLLQTSIVTKGYVYHNAFFCKLVFWWKETNSRLYSLTSKNTQSRELI